MNPTDQPNALDAQGRKDGPWSEADPHGGTMSGEYVHGDRVGHWQHRAGDGRLRSEGGYADSELHGAWTWYRANGTLLQKGGFDHGVKHGVWERWHKDGNLHDTTTWNLGRKQSPSRRPHRTSTPGRGHSRPQGRGS